MGQSSSAEQVSTEQREAESLAASTGALSKLQNAFALLSDHETKTIPITSLQKCFELKYDHLINEQTSVSKELSLLTSHLSVGIVELFFTGEEEGVNWVEFLQGYTNCCGRMVSSASFNNLFRVFESTIQKSGLPSKLQFEAYDDDFKINGSLSSKDLLMILYMCWIMSWDSKKLKSSYKKGDPNLPNVNHLVFSAIETCSENEDKLDFWDCDISSLNTQLPASKIHMWVLKIVPNLADCLSQFVYSRLCYLQTNEDKSTHETCLLTMSKTGLLTSGIAWAISLTLRGSLSDEISKECFPSDNNETDDNLIYRSSIHGKGLNRFWSNVSGYNSPTLMLISAYEGNNERKWIIGMLNDQGFENKETYYGNSGSLFAISPVFNVFSSSGKEKNFAYSHSQTVKVYEAHPKPIGIAFGGNLGNERIYMDEDFSKVITRHHAVDKTYQHGSLFPNQGFLPHEASVLEVEVWGLGGKRASEIQDSLNQREKLFNDQRRKIDLKTFANWEDSPEKMMMDMMSNPSAPRAEKR